MFRVEKAFEVVHITIVLTTPSDEWVGEGFWPFLSYSSWADDISRAVAACVVAALPALLDHTMKYRTKTSASRYQVRGPMAETCRRRFDDFEWSDSRNMTWTHANEVRYGCV